MEEGDDLQYFSTLIDLWRGTCEALKPGVLKEILTID
jgi:hypothetical protein